MSDKWHGVAYPASTSDTAYLYRQRQKASNLTISEQNIQSNTNNNQSFRQCMSPPARHLFAGHAPSLQQSIELIERGVAERDIAATCTGVMQNADARSEELG